ncbi:MAG: exodeoxyribonuclease VII small subunit [Planctomycetota bacterium]|jgi:exodeoxyribonuclease VII small subunit
MAKKKKAEENFEELIQATETAVEKLESGELSLEDAMAQYELGVKNLKVCAGIINEAREKVEQLIAEEDGDPVLAPIDTPEE